MSRVRFSLSANQVARHDDVLAGFLFSREPLRGMSRTAFRSSVLHEHALSDIRVAPTRRSLSSMEQRRTTHCSKCGTLKMRLRNGASRCRPCTNRWGRENYRRSALRRERERAAYVRRRYGLSIDGLERLLERQQGACGICRRPWLACPPAKRTKFEQHFLQHLCIDHDHKTGQIRGLLCNACNTAIGLFEEDIFRLTGAIAYVTLPTREPSSTRRVDTSRHDASV